MPAMASHGNTKEIVILRSAQASPYTPSFFPPTPHSSWRTLATSFRLTTRAINGPHMPGPSA